MHTTILISVLPEALPDYPSFFGKWDLPRANELEIQDLFLSIGKSFLFGHDDPDIKNFQQINVNIQGFCGHPVVSASALIYRNSLETFYDKSRYPGEGSLPSDAMGQVMKTFNGIAEYVRDTYEISLDKIVDISVRSRELHSPPDYTRILLSSTNKNGTLSTVKV